MNKDLSQQRDNNDKKPVGVVSVSHVSHSFSGPLPPPEVLEHFNRVVPGSAERIIRMAEEQFAHRTELEKKVINSDIARSKWGQILGFIIALVGLIVSAIVAIYGSAVAGGIIGVGTLASLVGVFMYGSKSRSSERETKRIEEKK